MSASSKRIVFAVACALCVAALAGPAAPVSTEPETSNSRPGRRAIVVDDWGYQLQGYRRDLATVRQTRFDLVVIDYSRWGDGESEWTAAQVEGVPSRFLCFPNEGHWVLGPQNGVLWHREFFGWLDRWCR